MTRSDRLKNALGRFSLVRERYLEKQRQEAEFLDRCGELLEHLRDVGASDEILEAAETLGDLVAFRHQDGEGNEIQLVFSPQRDRAVINERYLSEAPPSSKREGSDLLLAISSISREIDPDRCIIYQLLKPVEVIAVQYAEGSREPKPFIRNRFGLVRSKYHMLDFVHRLEEAPANEEKPLPGREAVPELIEACLEDELARSIDERTKAFERNLLGDDD